MTYIYEGAGARTIRYRDGRVRGTVERGRLIRIDPNYR